MIYELGLAEKGNWKSTYRYYNNNNIGISSTESKVKTTVQIINNVVMRLQ